MGRDVVREVGGGGVWPRAESQRVRKLFMAVPGSASDGACEEPGAVEPNLKYQ